MAPPGTLEDSIPTAAAATPGKIGTVRRLQGSRAWVELDAAPNVLRADVIVPDHVTPIEVGNRCIVLDGDDGATRRRGVILGKWSA